MGWGRGGAEFKAETPTPASLPSLYFSISLPCPLPSGLEVSPDGRPSGPLGHQGALPSAGAHYSLSLSFTPSYLEEAVMHLDHSDPITRDHMGSVMAQVRQKLFQFLQVEPHNSLGKVARRLSLMLHGLVTPSLP